MSKFIGQDYVVILHGVLRSSKNMSNLAEYLEEHGFKVLNIDYPSTKKNLKGLINYVQAQIIQAGFNDNRRINFVAFSLGGLITRGLIHKYRPLNLARVVLLAPPNKGSEVADSVKDNWLYKKFFGPVGQELITDQRAIEDLLGTVDYPVGIIAGNNTLDPISSYIIPGEDDGKVAVESTKLDGMTDHIVINGTHLLFPKNRKACEQTVHFLKKGRFERQ